MIFGQEMWNGKKGIENIQMNLTSKVFKGKYFAADRTEVKYNLFQIFS